MVNVDNLKEKAQSAVGKATKAAKVVVEVAEEKAGSAVGMATKVAKTVVGVAGEKAAQAKSVVVLKSAIIKERYSMNNNYRIIGQWYVNEYSDNIPDSISDIVNSINVSKEKIAGWKAELEAKGETITEDEEIEIGSMELAEPVDNTLKRCPLCGTESTGDFCVNCGSPLE